MTTAQISEALTDAEILLAAITELAELLAAGALDAAHRADIAPDLTDLAAAMATFAEQVAA